MALYYIILTFSWNLLLGYAGQLSFAHAAFAGIGAYTSGLLAHHYGVHPGLGIFIDGAVVAGIGWCLGRACLRTRGPYLALMTLGFSETVRLILQIKHDYTRAGRSGDEVLPRGDLRAHRGSAEGAGADIAGTSVHGGVTEHEL